MWLVSFNSEGNVSKDFDKASTRISDSFNSIANAWEDFSQIKKAKEMAKPLKDEANCINKESAMRSWTEMFSVNNLKKEVERYLNKTYLKNELRKLQKELESLAIYKRLPNATQKHLSQLEKQVEKLIDRIAKTQKQLDKEFTSALTNIQKKKKETSKRLKDLRAKALKQRDSLEKAIRDRLGMKAAKKTRKKATKAKKKATKKKTTKKKTAKKTTRRKKTT